MPVLVWEQSESGTLSNRVATTRQSVFSGEEHRPDAVAFDREVDAMLDHALDLVTPAQGEFHRKLAFARRWSLGRALGSSQLLESARLEPSEITNNYLWSALRLKCSLGVRSSGQIEPGWQQLIPEGEASIKRAEHDVFARGLWLQEQDLPDAQTTFGSSLSNANELHRRGPSSQIKMRCALLAWLLTYDKQSRALLTRSKNFEAIAKASSQEMAWARSGLGQAACALSAG